MVKDKRGCCDSLKVVLKGPDGKVKEERKVSTAKQIEKKKPMETGKEEVKDV
jgi:hypothetical protein